MLHLARDAICPSPGPVHIDRVLALFSNILIKLHSDVNLPEFCLSRRVGSRFLLLNVTRGP